MDEHHSELEGEVSRIVYTNPDNHWSVLRVKCDGEPNVITFVGTLAGVREGERLRVWGRWVTDRRYGRQLRVQRYQVLLPATVAGIEKYLSSGMIAGVGPKTARLLVKRFGEQTLAVIDKNPERLKSVKGIGKKRLSQLLKSWRENSGVREVMVFLQGLGISPTLAAKIHKEYGVEAVGRVRANPYDLAQDVWGVGFHKADRIATELGISDNHPERLKAGLIHVLQDARGQGHVCLPTDEFLAAGEQLLGVPADILSAEIAGLELSGRLIQESGEDLLYVPELHRAERNAAERILRLIDSDAPKIEESRLDIVLKSAEMSLGLDLSDSQREAVHLALTARVAVITGGPGTGKTTIVRAVTEALDALGDEVSLCAPTGRAAKRMGVATGREAVTIHRLLEWQPQEATFARDEFNPIKADSVVVDEVSMVDLPLFEKLLRALDEGARLLLVGDVDQLPSVGPGAVLADVIKSGTVPVVRLSQIYRQSEGSLITTNAHRILQGQMPLDPETEGSPADFYWVERNEPESILGVIGKVICERIPAAFGFDPVSDVQVLTPMHRATLGAEGLNTMLSHRLNPNRSDRRFAPGDKVMQTKNNYEKEVYNGDVGFVESVAADGRTLFVRFDEPERRTVVFDSADQEQLVMAWAITIHKSQGSEYPAVVIPVHTQHFMMLRRNLIYTAVTRGKKLVVLVGSRKALGLALRESTVLPRYGRLAQRLEELAR